MQNDKLNIEEVYEAIYIARKTDILNVKNNVIKQSAIDAIYRIMKVTNLTSLHDMDTFLNEYKNKKLDIQSERLYSKLCSDDGGSFFNIISEEELRLYHYYNYQVSYEYGINLAKAINFEYKNILDIGGSSGGLCRGLKKTFKTTSCSVYDTPFACKIGEELSLNNPNEIRFIEGDFFKYIDIKENFDYIFMSNVIHNWNDTNSINIFNNIKSLLKSNTKMIIYEDLLFDNDSKPIETVIYGLRLCANVPEGRQRTIEELKILIENALKINIQIEQIINFGVHSAMIISF